MKYFGIYLFFGVLFSNAVLGSDINQKACDYVLAILEKSKTDALEAISRGEQPLLGDPLFFPDDKALNELMTGIRSSVSIVLSDLIKERDPSAFEAKLKSFSDHRVVSITMPSAQPMGGGSNLHITYSDGTTAVLALRRSGFKFHKQ